MVSEWQPKHNRWAIALTVTLATFMEVLDTSIANVALPHIAGNLSASSDEATWVLTSYLVSNAVILPISAWLATVMGRKRFYMTCVALFGVSSFLCGLAPSLGVLVMCRILQGAGGGGLAPSEQAILADTFSPSARGMAFAVYGMAVVVAPAIGPTMGGWLTDNFSWRWVFYINVPVAIISLLLTQRIVEDPPYLAEEKKKARGVRPDLMGLGLITLAIGCLQVVLDKGQEADWFSTWWITFAFWTAAAAFACWIVWEWHHKYPIVNIRLFKKRNFAVAMFFTFVLGIVLFGTTVVIPQFLQLLLGYPAELAGEALAGGGFAMMVMMPVAGLLVGRMDPRLLMAAGFAGTAASLFWMTSKISLGLDFNTAFMVRTLQTVSLPFIFLPSNTLAYVGMAREQNNQVSGMNAFVRNIGGSIGIALITTFITRQGQKHESILASHTVPGSQAFDSMLNGIRGMMMSKGADAAMATQQAYAQINGMILGQATTMAYVDVLSILALVVAGLIPFVFLMRRGRPGPAPAAH